jgi:NitT/TauT family transport system substrate-binding protein
MVTRREVLRRGVGAAAALTAGPFLASCAPAAVSAPTATAGVPTATPTLPPPETTSIAITVAPCDSAMFAAERFLREEGFTEVNIGDRAALGEMTAGKAQLGSAFPMTFFAAAESGPKVICLGGLHTGCAEVWAQPGISSVKDLKGRNITVTSKSLGNIPYAYFVMLLQQAGLDPAKDVNFVVQSDADPLRLYLDGKNDAVFVATTGAVTIKTNPANKGKMINSQVMDQPWASTNCCFITASEQWYRANPIAAKRAMRAIYRTADALPADRGDAAKAATDKGLFGGAAATANVREAANMVPLDWRNYDVEKAVRFYAPLLPGVLKASTDDLLKALDLKIFKELSSELKK